ncbi:F1 complex, OSCP/delta subunit of ATPase [Basidiobolus meristosporus CBS 931.73]|uniref:ATP synthase subunit 5, mitochondrial n=1 Tax=Basidiobolus meristosporus CBS 931.73 TaxID=1314790 RepID=A0A1Y1Z323_9FUNG|nr:F1 complex, OSCP/delta subunit of ATPase [Basidiobolus meristosporus CBS 931.73]|eukprot:ORY04609.1 F1 complex, OSCP/delta subunit of ATPase [Basidiobolus meristosporus CBS 931.73]
MLLTRVVAGSLRSVRTYATSTKVQVPLTLFGIDGRYATALFTAAAKKNKLEAVEGEMTRIGGFIEKNPKIQFFLENPTLSRDQKKAGLELLFKEYKYSEVTRNLFELLADNGRLNETTKIISAYRSLMMAQRGEVLVTVTSAVDLKPVQLRQIKESLAKGTLAGNSKLTIQNKVNPTILGGLIIEFGDKTIDLSVAAKVAKLNKLLTDAI